MGLFDLFKRKPAVAPIIAACTAGKIVPMEDVPDEILRQGILGPCVGIEPVDGRVYAPCDGVITQLTETLHAIGLTGVLDAEVLIHCGVDTVAMNGDGFTNAVTRGQTVRKGELMMTMDLEKIRAAGYPTTVITIITNAQDYSAVKTVAAEEVAVGDDLMKLIQ